MVLRYDIEDLQKVQTISKLLSKTTFNGWYIPFTYKSVHRPKNKTKILFIMKPMYFSLHSEFKKS